MAANRLVWPKMAKPKVVCAWVYRVLGVPGRGSHVRCVSAPATFLSEVCTTWYPVLVQDTFAPVRPKSDLGPGSWLKLHSQYVV